MTDSIKAYQNKKLSMEITLNKITKEDFPYLIQFPPESWGFDLAAFAEENLSNESVRFITAKYRGKLIGVGNIIINGRVGWIGNMIVAKTYQRQGIGRNIFRKLIQIGKLNKVEKFALIATDEGYPLYLKEGFIPVGYYNFYSKPKSLSDAKAQVVELLPRERPAVWELDQHITGEDRESFLSRYAPRVWGIKTGSELMGVYYPEYGTGSILALDEAAGIDLLRFRLHHTTHLKTVVPEDNEPVNRFMKKVGSQITMRVMRMEKPATPKWKPEMIFSRGTGYAG